MSLLEKIQYLVAGRLINKTEEEAQNAAYLLVRRDLELTKANGKLKNLNNAKGDFIAMAAHQLRTPITTINWYAEVLAGETLGELNAKQKEYVQTIHTSSVHMAQLIDTLLYISRLELGTSEIHNKSFNLGDLIQHIYKRLEPEGKEKNHKMSISTQNVKIMSDKTLFDIIFYNLLSNAMKYTPRGGSITVEEKVLEPGTQWGHRTFSQQQLTIRVTDTGYGIPDAHKHKIFTRLFRADNIKTLGIGGTGLGLYLSKLVVGKMGGEIWFDTHEALGTSFYVAIPYSLVKPHS